MNKGSIPHVTQYPENGRYPRLFFSQREIALIKDKTVSPGYGVLKAGTVMAVNISAAGNKGLLVPYVPVYGNMVAALNNDAAIGISPMVANASSGHVYVSVKDSYKYVVGDQLYFQNTAGDGLVDCGVITAIDRTTNPLWADIACGAFTATNGTLAKHAYVYVVAGTTPFSTAKYILDKDIDTGTGEEALGALTSVVISNAILYSAALKNATAEALTALSGTADGQHVIFK